MSNDGEADGRVSGEEVSQLQASLEAQTASLAALEAEAAALADLQAKLTQELLQEETELALLHSAQGGELAKPAARFLPSVREEAEAEEGGDGDISHASTCTPASAAPGHGTRSDERRAHVDVDEG
ncbi:MAG: hypothetical protein EOP49_31215, partial [Sphingobacteriales bacterium]